LLAAELSDQVREKLGVTKANVKKALLGHYGKPAAGERDPKDSARDIMAAFEGYRGRALFIYGGADREASGAAQHFGAFTGAHGIPATFETVEGANHDFYSLAWERRITERTIGWVTERAG
jgi:acetyl esterase/lipase